MLVLIGLGLWDEKDISLKGLERVKDMDIAYLESYTSKLCGANKEQIEKVIGKKIQLANREFIESGKILEYCKSNKVALLVGGDPLTATTHIDLLLRAKKANIKTEIIHNASIFTAIAETGLQLYKFGKSATITFWEENYKPTSFYDTVKQNQGLSLHTLLFLDIKVEQNKYMTPNQAIGILSKCGMPETQKVIVCSRLGSTDSQIIYKEIKELKNMEFGNPLHILIVPTKKMHELEQEYLLQFT